MSAPLNASATTIGQLIAGATFEIPAFQREYAWGEEQVKEFWSDLSHAMSGDSYFLGLIILTAENERKRKQVVDGQQRLLSISLLAASLYHAAMNIGRNALADRLHSTLLRSLDYATDNENPRIVLSDARANKTFQSIIEYGSLNEDEIKGESSERLWKAYNFLNSELLNSEEEDKFRKLGAWAEFITEQIYVAVFDHQDEAAAYSVFEVVNTRGKQLTTADLLKNFVLYHTGEADRAARYGQWYEMVEKFEQVGGQNFVHYIRHVVNLRTGYLLPKNLYNYVAKRGDFSDADVPNVDELMALLQMNLPLYLQIVDPTLDGPADPLALDIYVALNELGVEAVRPLLLAVSTTPNALAGLEEILRLVVKRIVVGNLGASSVERKFAEAARIVHRSGFWEEGLEVIRDMNHPRAEFEAQLTRRNFNRSIMSFIRRSLVHRSITPPSEGILQYLRPRQSPEDAWPDFSGDEFSFWGTTIGNSILVDIKRRPKDTSSWQGVRDHLLPHAIDGEDVGLLSKHSSWTQSAVEQVGQQLAVRAADVWY